MTPSDLQMIREAYERGLAHGQRLAKSDVNDWLFRSIFDHGVEVGTARGRELGREQARRERKAARR